MRHLLKYGAGVAAASGALLTLWQLYGLNEGEKAKQKFFVTHPQANQFEMPQDLIEFKEVYVLGDISCTPDADPSINVVVEIPEVSVDPISLIVSPVDLESLIPNLDKLEIPSPKIDRSFPKSPITRARGTHSAG